MADSAALKSRSELFGSYKAEWLGEHIFEFFTQPAYVPELEANRPCVLIGGRGTGKTTVLRSLSYEGRLALAGAIETWPYYGFYYRANTNRLAAFQGPEFTDQVWRQLFGHYLNVLLCGQTLRFLLWYGTQRPEAVSIPAADCRKIAISLHLQPCESVAQLAEELDSSRITFEAYLNNMNPNDKPKLSLHGAPIDELFKSISALPHFAGKHFFFLIDEYENFSTDQQIVFNTLIKHAGGGYTFKIGVKDLGWRTRSTLRAEEQLNSPADFVRIDLAEKLDDDTFSAFAKRVCEHRLRTIYADIPPEELQVEALLPTLTDEQEAVHLGVSGLIPNMRQSLAELDDGKWRSAAEDMSPLELYFIQFWSTSKKSTLSQVMTERDIHPKKWNDRYDNYKHAILFTIKRGKTGIRKYYAGWKTFLLLASSNIRYLLELVDQTLQLHEAQEKNVSGHMSPVSYEVQTQAAQSVGRKNLFELEGSKNGAHLTKLLLGLGRVFEVMALNPEGHAPEQNQFYLNDTATMPEELHELLVASVMQLALVRSVGNKLSTQNDMRAFDYSMHPIFAPFFVFSHRKKRKICLTADAILGFVHQPRDTIKATLVGQGRENEEPLPTQLRLFEGHYAGTA